MELAVQTRGDWNLILTAARWAEDRGLVALALQTSRLELVSLLSPVTFRHPAVSYKMGVALDEISGGRFTMGIGTGWLDEEFELFGIPYPDRNTRFELLAEYMAYLRAAVAPEARGFEGEHFHLADFDPHPHPQNLRLLVGGAGTMKTPQIAGQYADEFNIYACPPEDYSAKKDRAMEAAREVGRDPETILFSTACPAIAAKGEEDYRRLLQLLAGRTGSSPERIEQVYEERGYLHGSGSKPAEMLLALEEAGCERFYPQMFLGNPNDYDTILDAYST